MRPRRRRTRRGRAGALVPSLIIGLVSCVLALAVGGLAADPAQAAPGPADAPQYYLDQWHIPQLWAQGVRGQGVTIAELDTGVNAALPSLAGKILPGVDFGVGPAGGGDGRTDHDTDPFGHGTAMASIMVAAPGPFGIVGIAPAARILPIALPLQGTNDAASDDHLPEAIRYAADHGADIISMSLGEARKPATNAVPCPDAEQQAIFYAMNKGAVLVAASGNQGETGSPVVHPGVCLGVVSVGAVDAAGIVAPFSSRHPYLTLTAPGVAIASLSRVPGLAYSGDGTSQATALTAAGLALVKSAHPTLSPRQLVARLLATADPAPGAAPGSRDPSYGFGRLEVDSAVSADVPATAPDPVYAAAAPFLAQYEAGLSVAAEPVPPAPAPVPMVGPGGQAATGTPGGLPALTVWSAGAALAGLLCAALALRRLGRPRGGRPVTGPPPG